MILRPSYHFKSLQNDGEEYVDENPGACDGKDDEENRRDMGLLFEAPELELVQQHGGWNKYDQSWQRYYPYTA